MDEKLQQIMDWIDLPLADRPQLILGKSMFPNYHASVLILS